MVIIAHAANKRRWVGPALPDLRGSRSVHNEVRVSANTRRRMFGTEPSYTVTVPVVVVRVVLEVLVVDDTTVTVAAIT